MYRPCKLGGCAADTRHRHARCRRLAGIQNQLQDGCGNRAWYCCRQSYHHRCRGRLRDCRLLHRTCRRRQRSGGGRCCDDRTCRRRLSGWCHTHRRLRHVCTSGHRGTRRRARYRPCSCSCARYPCSCSCSCRHLWSSVCDCSGRCCGGSSCFPAVAAGYNDLHSADANEYHPQP